MDLRFSVCICTHNRSKLLAHCLESVVHQEYAPDAFEVLVVDNASNDGTAAVVSEYSAKYSNVRGCFEPVVGISRARNRAGLEAYGEWLAFLDDDALAPPGWLAAAERAAETNAPDLLGGPVTPYFDSPKPAWFSNSYGTIGHGDAPELLPAEKYLLGGNFFIRREVFARSEGFPLDFGLVGERQDYGDETAFQNRLRQRHPNLRALYDPALAVEHRVAPQKMKITWRLRYRFVESRAGYRAHNSDLSSIKLKHIIGYTAIPAIILVEGTLGALLRNRRKYPHWQNYYYEAITARMATWGRLHERLIQGFRRDYRVNRARRTLRLDFQRAHSWLRRKLRVYRHRFDLDLRLAPREQLTRRALLAYIVHPFEIEPDDPRFYRHINIWHACEIALVLNEMGYSVDAVDYRDRRFKPGRSYELFIGHGGVNFTEISSELPPETPRIYFSTGAYWQFHNREEQQRFADLARRRRVDLPPDRLILDSEEDALRRSDGIIGIGNAFTRTTYTGFERVRMIDGTTLFDPAASQITRDYPAARRHFLFFASHGNVHKGLDLLLEVFAEVSADLWIMTPIERRFREVYRNELSRCPKIHLLGWTQPRSMEFYKIIERCAWCILPSSSEGQAQSVVEAMKYGLVPLVSRAAGVDVDDFGEIIEPPTVENIRMFVIRVSQLPVENVIARSNRARAAAETRYSEAAFRRNFRNALETLLAPSEATSPIERPASDLPMTPHGASE